MTIVSAGRALYNAYQDHTARGRQATLPPTNATMMQTQSHLDQVNGEILKGAGVDPPAYTPAVMNRRTISPEPPQYEATFQGLDQNDMSGNERTGDFNEQLRTTSSKDSSINTPTSGYLAKKELKAAYKAVRRNEKALYKAEKHSMKAERKNIKAMRECCC